MLLSDSRLRFARELIGHWMHIRHGKLVPLEEDIDPREPVGLFPWITIADLSEPETATLEVVGAGVARRFATDLRKANWIDFFPPEIRRSAAIALTHDLLCGSPVSPFSVDARKMDEFSAEFIDIGAGAPSGFSAP